MDHKTARIQSMFTKARTDPEYAALTEAYEYAYGIFDRLVAAMDEKDQDLIWGFVCLSDQMNWRMLELICQWYDE